MPPPRLAAVGPDLRPGGPGPGALQEVPARISPLASLIGFARNGPSMPRVARPGRITGSPKWWTSCTPRSTGGTPADLEVEPDPVPVAPEEHGVPDGLVRLLVELGRQPVVRLCLVRRPDPDILLPLARAAESGGDQRTVGCFDDGRRVRPREGRILPNEVERVLLRRGLRCDRDENGERERELRASA